MRQEDIGARPARLRIVIQHGVELEVTGIAQMM